jgi:DNA-binding transcriptional LysR family regulator
VVSLARLKNVTRAAEENFVAQPTMTSTITAVENELGVRLFNRSKRGVSLTSAGEAFAKAAESILAQYSRAVSEARRLGTLCETPADLTIGFSGLSMGNSIHTVLRTFSLSHADVNIRFCKTTVSDLPRCLLDGRADLVLSNQFEMRRYPDLYELPIIETNSCVFVHENHPLAAHARLSPDDLRGSRLLCASSVDNPQNLSAAALVLKQAGVPFTDDSPIYNEEAIVSMVEAGLGVYPAAVWFRRAFSDSVVCLPLDLEVEHMRIVIAWKDERLLPIAEELAAIVRDVFEGRTTELC